MAAKLTPPCVVSIFVGATKAGPMTSRTRVTAVAGKGLVGDRYYRQRGTFSKPEANGEQRADRQITLIEEEALLAAKRDYAVTLAPKETRRNVLTRGVSLNHLIDREFRVGDVVLRGLKLCEPCGHLVKLTGIERARDALIHRGGLRCAIVSGGVIKRGDVVSAGA